MISSRRPGRLESVVSACNWTGAAFSSFSVPAGPAHGDPIGVGVLVDHIQVRRGEPATDFLDGMPRGDLGVVPVVVDGGVGLGIQLVAPEALHEEVVEEPL